MAVRPALRVSLLIGSLVAIPLSTESFILPFSPSKVGLQHPAASQLPAIKSALSTQPERGQSNKRRQRPSFRRHVLGPDGKDIDVRRHREAYSYPGYWEDFYAGGDAGELANGERYDWFFGYSRLAVYLNLHIGGARQGRVLVIGCGNSEVSPKMYEDGWKNILNIDFCQPVIEAMEKAHRDKLGMEWKVMDARDMASLETASFDAVIDKGLTDSVMHNDKFALMMAQVSFEVARVLKPGGVYLLTDYRDSERVQEIFKRDEWEGGTLTQEGKITPAVNLFKGKRSEVEPKDPFTATMEEIDEGDEGQEDDEEAPAWLSDAIANGAIKLRMEENLEGVDVPAENIGRKKPFKF